MRFSKWHALGNSYLVVERADAGEPLSAERVRRLCDVNVGIGSDGVLEVVEADASGARVVIWNPDGSQAEFSGNGTRIAARWTMKRSGVREVEIRVGDRRLTARQQDGTTVVMDVGDVEVDRPETLDVHGNPIDLIPVRVGNPHAVIPCEEPTREVLLRLGPLIETHPRFPHRTNVQLAHPDGRHDVRALVWERGTGETPASGSSATAVAAVAVAQGWCESPVTVHMPGGDLVVTLENGRATLTGPAEEICTGNMTI